jgi:hypothetical protein
MVSYDLVYESHPHLTVLHAATVLAYVCINIDMQLLGPHATEPQELRQRSGKSTKWDERISICPSRPSTALLEAAPRQFHDKDNINE